MANKRILLVGGGGHCKSILDSLLEMGLYDDIGIIEKSSAEKRDILGIPVIGTDGDFWNLFDAGWTDAFISLGSLGNPSRRHFLFDALIKIGFAVPSIVDRTAVVSANVRLDPGVFIGKRAIVNTGAHIGACAIINTGAVVEHDCVVGAFAHISSGTVLCGDITIGSNTHIGAGSVIRQQLVIGNDSILGIGSVVTKNIPEYVIAYGNPCHIIRKL